MEATQKSTPTAEELDKLWQEFESCQPALTSDELEGASTMLFGREGVRTVRAGLLMLTKSGRELLEVMHTDSEMAAAYTELAACTQDRATRLRGVADALEMASMRLRCALCDAGEVRNA